MSEKEEVKNASGLLTISLFLCLFAYAIYLVVIQKTLYDIGNAYHLTEARQGSIVSFNFIGFIIAMLLSSYFSEVFGKKRIILYGTAVFSIASLLFGFIPNLNVDGNAKYYLSVVVIFFIGAGTAVMEGVASALISDLHKERKALYLNLSQVFFGLGAVITPTISEKLYKFGSMIPNGPAIDAFLKIRDWNLSFYFIGITGIAVFFILLFQKCGRYVDEEGMRFSVIKGLISNKVFLALTLSIALYVGAEVGLCSWINEYMRKDNSFLLDSESAGHSLTIFWIAMLIGRILYGPLIEKFNYKLILNVSSVMVIVAIVGMVFPERISEFIDVAPYHVVFFFAGMVGFFMSGMFATILAFTGEVFTRYSGTVMGLMVASAGVGGVIFPYVIGRIYDGTGSLRPGILTCAVYMVAVLLIFIILKNPRKNQRV